MGGWKVCAKSYGLITILKYSVCSAGFSYASAVLEVKYCKHFYNKKSGIEEDTTVLQKMVI